MRHLNYSHLHYFWTVANEGSIARAAEVLHITPQTISGQLKLLDEAVGEPLFQRAGRGLVLTDTGNLVKQYADDIFALGGELAQVVRGRQAVGQVLNVGIVNSIAKLIAHRVLQPVVATESDMRLCCVEGDLDDLLADLAVHRLDLVLSDRRLPVNTNVKAYNHTLGDSAIALFCKPAAIRRYQTNFPQSLHGAPMLMPGRGSALRRDLDDWFEQVGIEPRVVAEFDDSALLKMFGAGDAGVFPAPHAIAPEIERMYSARVIGMAEGVRETYLAISPERRLKNPAVLAVIEQAREQLFPAA
ncbi:transcriptional activator NhaR [Seongchinamella sediminis]|uniref:Transcriptional activator NhaR n=1 Tax=Seongchinamella sediminis TaxID=2283635 RepID=A0A3L7DYN3_9GAMM|nr:transcriptional activator NhaR [Seongchinamella sediminis]RLQ21769.1 transcriptional activator NhaR [Seongchinamella sediminis]